MRTKLIAISGILAAAMTATIAVGNWTTLPFAIGPVVVDQNKNVSVDFVIATASEILSWLKKSGVNFVIETQDVPQDKRLTVHLKNQPMDKAIEAIADALGLKWTKKGDIYALKNGFGDWTSFAPKIALEAEGQAQRLGDKLEMWAPEPGKAWKLNPEDAQKWERLGKEMESKFKDIEPKVFEWKSEDGKFRMVEPKAFEKLLEGRLKDFKLKGLDEKQLEKLKDLQKFEFKDIPKIELELKELDKLDGDLAKRLKELPDLGRIELGLGDIGKLIESLTPEQIEKNKSRGYLTPDDLTPAQRKMLGDWGKDADFSIVFSKEGRTVTIKGK